MRITGGRFRGRQLAPPADARLRPTADRVRQAIFNILDHNDFACGFTLIGARAIDLFAGTGAMGIESLSRGALFCLFVDSAVEARALLRANIEALALGGITKIWRRDATELGPVTPGAGGPFNLVFLDPPYRQNLIPPALASLQAGGWLASEALIVAEHAADEELRLVDSFTPIDSRNYGGTAIKVVRFGRA